MAVNGSREGLFDAAVSAVLKAWPALKMVVTNQFGGPQSQAKATWMESATAQWMKENVDIQPDELQSFLETLLDQEFDTVIEDGSTLEVSRKVCELYRSCCSGNQDTVRTFLSTQPLPPPLPLSPPPPPPPPVSQPSHEESEEEKMEEEDNIEAASTDEGGGGEGEWEVVRKSRRRRSKN